MKDKRPMPDDWAFHPAGVFQAFLTVPVGTIGKRERKRACPPAPPYVSAKRQRMAEKRVMMRAARHKAHLMDWRDR